MGYGTRRQDTKQAMEAAHLGLRPNSSGDKSSPPSLEAPWLACWGMGFRYKKGRDTFRVPLGPVGRGVCCLTDSLSGSSPSTEASGAWMGSDSSAVGLRRSSTIFQDSFDPELNQSHWHRQLRHGFCAPGRHERRTAQDSPSMSVADGELPLLEFRTDLLASEAGTSTSSQAPRKPSLNLRT